MVSTPSPLETSTHQKFHKKCQEDETAAGSLEEGASSGFGVRRHAGFPSTSPRELFCGLSFKTWNLRCAALSQKPGLAVAVC